MRRLLPAAALALALHGLLFTVRFEGPKTKLTLHPRPLTLSLAQGPTEPPPSFKMSTIPESPALPPRPSQVQEEKPQFRKTRLPEKSAKRTRSPAPLQQEQVNSSAESPSSITEQAATPAPRQMAHPATASLGEGGRGSQPPPVHEATPLYRRNPLPEYPLSARKRGFQGTVVLEVLVDPQGRVADLRLSSSSGYSVLDQAALASVKTWLFDPGMRGEEKVEMWVKVPVRFRLE